MAEREEEYHQEMAEKMQKFLMEHAARVIQVAWRDVLANRAEKKRVRQYSLKCSCVLISLKFQEWKSFCGFVKQLPTFTL